MSAWRAVSDWCNAKGVRSVAFCEALVPMRLRRFVSFASLAIPAWLPHDSLHDVVCDLAHGSL